MTISIHDGQLAQIAERRFQSRLLECIGEIDPQAGRELATAEGGKELRRQCERARAYGLRAELDIARYVVTAWLLGVDFDTRFPAMQQVLATDRLQPAQKADAIEKIAMAVFKELARGRE